MRMISQQLAEEMPDNSMPQECSRPWLRRRPCNIVKQELETSATTEPSNPEMDGVILEDGMAHIEQ
jgi:hypothetical protein